MIIGPNEQSLLVSKSFTGSGTYEYDFAADGAAVMLGIVVPELTSGTVTVTLHPLYEGTYQGVALVTQGPFSSAFTSPVEVVSNTTAQRLRLKITYTGDCTVHVHSKSLPSPAIVGLETKLSTKIIREGESLANSATYTSSWEDVSTFGGITFTLHTTRDVTIYADLSLDGSTSHRTVTFNQLANTAIPHTLARVSKWFRLRVSNTSGNSATLWLQTFYSSYPKSTLTTNLSSTLTDTSDAELNRTVLVGETDGGQYINVPVTGEGHIEVDVHGPILPFSSIHTERLRPVFQIDAVYGANPTEVGSGSTLTGVATASEGLFTVSTGTTVGASAFIQSRRRLRYRPGQGSVMRFTAKFTTPVASSYQVAGLGHAEDGYYFGYKNSTFGILHNVRGVREVQTLTLSSASSTNENVTVTLNNVPFSVAVTNSGNIHRTAYEISRGTFAGWDAEAIDGTVVFVAGDAAVKSGTFTLSGTTAAGTFAETKAGAAAGETFIAQSSWNADKMDGTGRSGVTIDPTKLNVYQIGMAYLGAGAIRFQVMVSPGNNNPTWETVHVINNPNVLTLPHVGNPSFPFTMAVYSAGSNTNLTVSSGSFAGFIEGDKFTTGPRISYHNSSTAVTAAAYHNIFSLRNTRYYQNRSNQAVLNILSISGAIKHTSPVTVFLFRNATLVGNPLFASYATGSSSYYDTAATTCTIASNNQLIWSGTLGETGNFLFSFTDDITVQPGETITVAARSSTGSPSWVIASLNTREDQ